MTIEELKDWKDDVRNELERDLEQVREKHEQISNYLRVLDAVDEMVTEHKSLKRQLDDKQDEIDNLKDEIDKVQSDNDALRQQLLDEKERRLSSQTKLSELSKLSAGVAKKSSQDELIKAMRSYLNISRRKTQGKREAAKMVFMEMFTSAKLELPDDIMESLDHLDDDQDDPKVVNVTGNYNDVHDNGRVDLKE
jgi:chromosome segregation ATPase